MTQEQVGIDVAAYRRPIDETNRPVFTKEQGSVALERHGFGSVLEWVELEANFVNSVFRATSTEGGYIVKIKFRPGFSLEVQYDATQLIQTATSLPACHTRILDEDIEPFVHPFLICNRLPGRQGQTVFERADESVQLRILREYGWIVASLHRIDLSTPSLPTRDYSDWRGLIHNNFLDDDELIEALPLACQKRVPIIAELLDEVEVSVPAVPQGFLWGDAVLRNLLLDDDGRLMGVIDFENAARGDLLMDQLSVDSEFTGRREPREIYGRADYRTAFWDAYQLAGGVRIEPDATYVEVRKIVQCTGFTWLWKAARVLSPEVPMYIEKLELRLRNLAALA